MTFRSSSTCYYSGDRHFTDIKSMLIKTSSFLTIFHFVIVSILVEWLGNNNFGLMKTGPIFEISETILKFLLPPETLHMVYLSNTIH